jgi:predicted MFS family arabinose efflux permease
MADVEERKSGATAPLSGAGEGVILRRHPALWAVLSAEGLSATGDAVFWVGLLVWLLGRPHATALIAVAAFARLGPRVLFGAAGGVIADAVDRRVLLVVLDAARAALMVALMFLVGSDGSTAAVMTIVFVTYVLATPYRPAFTAGIPFVVGERDAAAANALDGAVRQVATFLGPLLGTAVLWLGEPSWAFAVNAVTFALSAILVARVRRFSDGTQPGHLRRLGARPGAWRGSLRDGVEAVVRQPGLSLMMWLVFVFSVARGFELVLLVLVAQDRLAMGAQGVGVLSAAIGVGALLVVPHAGRIANADRPVLVVVTSLILTSVPLVLLGVTQRASVAFAVLIAVGVGVVAFEVLAVTLIQRLSRLGSLGRVFGIENIAVNGGKLVGSLLGTFLVAALSLRDALFAAAGLVVVSALLAIPRLHGVAAASAARRKELEPVVRVLARLALFDGASTPALERLARSAQDSTVRSGARAVTEGDLPEHLYVIRSGRFDVVKQGVKVAALGTDDWFGEIGLLQHIPRTATVVAAAESQVWVIPGAEFLSAINESALPPAALLEEISARLRELDELA